MAGDIELAERCCTGRRRRRTMKEKLRRFFEPLKEMLFKPKDWEEIGDYGRREWKRQRTDLLLSFIALGVSVIALSIRLLQK
jgi:hypothetical protein